MQFKFCFFLSVVLEEDWVDFKVYGFEYYAVRGTYAPFWCLVHKSAVLWAESAVELIVVGEGTVGEADPYAINGSLFRVTSVRGLPGPKDRGAISVAATPTGGGPGYEPVGMVANVVTF